MPTEEEERKAKAERAKKLLAQRQKKAKAAASSATTPAPSNPSSSPALTDVDAGLASARTSMSIDDRTELAPPPKGEARRKKAVKPDVEEDVDAGKEAVVEETKQAETKAEEMKEEKAEETKAEKAVPAKEADVPTATVESATPSQSPRPNTDSIEATAKLQETVSLLIAERADLQSQLSARDADLASAAADRKLLDEGRAITASLEAEKAVLVARVEALELETKVAKSLESSLAEAKGEVESLKEEVKKLEAAAKAEESGRAKVAAKNEEKVTGLERGLERAREREGVLEKEVGRLRKVEIELKSTLEGRSSEVSAVQADLGDARQQLESTRGEQAALQTLHDTLSSAHTSLQATHTSLTAGLAQLRTDYSSQTEQLRVAESSLSNTKADLEKANTTLSTDQKRADAAEKKRTALQTENADLLRQLEEVRGKVSLVMEEKAELAGELDSAKGQIKRVDDQAVKRLEEELQASASRVQALTRQLADLQAAYASSQKERGEARRTPSAETPPLSRTSNVNRTVDAILPANVRHKRQVSLTALKARMGSSFTRGGMESLAENPGERKQFGDEIMFCCPACEGDLITL